MSCSRWKRLVAEIRSQLWDGPRSLAGAAWGVVALRIGRAATGGGRQHRPSKRLEWLLEGDTAYSALFLRYM